MLKEKGEGGRRGETETGSPIAHAVYASRQGVVHEYNPAILPYVERSDCNV